MPKEIAALEGECMKTETDKKKLLFSWFVISIAAVLVFTMPFHAAGIQQCCEKSDAEAGNGISNAQVTDAQMTGLSLADRHGTSIGIANAKETFLDFQSQNMLGAPFNLKINQDKDYQSAAVEPFLGIPFKNRSREQLSGKLQKDQTGRLSLGTNQLLLVFGLIGFLSNRNRKTTKHNYINS
jgi:hypothetical protein